MKTIMMAIGILVPSLSTGALYANENPGFDRDLSSLRKNLIQICGKLQSANAETSRDSILKGIDETMAAWNSMALKYSNDIPEQYAGDKGWKGYFAEAADNFSLMKARAEEGKYGRAVQFCGMNCALFVKIHQVNGTVTIADKMFTLRMNAKLFVSMALASNTKGLVKMMKHTDEVLEDIHNMPAPADADKTAYAADIAKLDEIYASLKTVAGKGSDTEINEGMVAFMKEFGKIYFKYI